MSELTPKNIDEKTALGRSGNKYATMREQMEIAKDYAQVVIASGVIPDSLKVMRQQVMENGTRQEVIDPHATSGRIVQVILKALEVGMKPLMGLSNIMFVNDRMCIWGDAALAMIQNSDNYISHHEELTGQPKTDDWTATCTFIRKSGGKEIEIKRSFTWGQAKTAGIIKFVWNKYPERMLQMRARSWAIRDGFADVMAGLSVAEEARDFEAEQPKKVEVQKVQNDPFTAKALEDRSNDLDKINMQDMADKAELLSTESEDKPVDEVVEQKAEPALQEEVKDDPFPGCTTCNGRGLVETEDKDPETGEIIQGKGPCPECSPTPPKDDGDDKPIDQGDLLMAG